MKKLFLLLSIASSIFAENEYFWEKHQNVFIEQAIKNSNVEKLSELLDSVQFSEEEKAYYLKLAENIIKNREENFNNFRILSHAKVNDKHLLPHLNSLVRQDYLTKLTILVASAGLIAFFAQDTKYVNSVQKAALFGIPVGGASALISFAMIFNNGLKTYRTLKMLLDNALEIKDLIEAHDIIIQEIVEQINI